jgi:hypothetical protein
MQKLNDVEKEPGNPFTVCNYISVGNYFKKTASQYTVVPGFQHI